MFGYVTPFKSELKIREYNLFRAYYCGLCKTMGNEYNQLVRMGLNYDLSFLCRFLDWHLGVIDPQLATGAGVKCINRAPRPGHVHHAAHHDGRGLDAAWLAKLVAPGQAQLTDIGTVDVREWAETLLVRALAMLGPGLVFQGRGGWPGGWCGGWRSLRLASSAEKCRSQSRCGQSAAQKA